MRTKPIIDIDYLKYIEQLPCLICGHTPKGTRKVYFEFTDEFKEYPCKNNAHHVDTNRIKRNNDHRIVPICSHISVSGYGSKDCHAIEHSNELKTTDRDKWLIGIADQYYQVYLERLGKL